MQDFSVDKTTYGYIAQAAMRFRFFTGEEEYWNDRAFKDLAEA